MVMFILFLFVVLLAATVVVLAWVCEYRTLAVKCGSSEVLIDGRLARRRMYCIYCGESYRQLKDPRGQLCPSCGKSVVTVTFVSPPQVDTDRYSYKTPGQKWDTCGCVGKEKLHASVMYPFMQICEECALDEADFIKPLQK